MPRLEVPLVYRRLGATGDVVVHGELNLEIKTNSGGWETVLFWVDSGTEMTTMSAEVEGARLAASQTTSARFDISRTGNPLGGAAGANFGTGRDRVHLSLLLHR